MSETVFARSDRWLPTVVREGKGLRLEFAGGADANHDPRAFSIPIEEAHLAVLREDLARHLILASALMPLGHAAGISGPINETAAIALLNPILLAEPDDVDAFLEHTKREEGHLIAHGADIEVLEDGRVLESLSAATESSDWQRAQEYDANRRRARRGVTLSLLDTAILKFTGQYIHGATIPHRDPEAVEPALLPEVLRVIATAEYASAGMSIARDPRQGRTGTDKQDWKRMEAAVAAAVRVAHPELADDAVKTLAFLMCSEAADRARRKPFDAITADVGPQRERTLRITDDTDVEKKWNPGDDRAPAEVFWEFVAERIGSRNDVFTLEDEALGDGIQLHFYASSIARVETILKGDSDSTTTYRVEYGLVDGLTHYKALVRTYIAGGFDALDGSAQWIADNAEFEEARRRRDGK